MPSFEIPSDPAFWQDPFPFFHDALAMGCSVFSTPGGFAVLGYDALLTLGRDPRVEGFPFGPDGMGPDNADIGAMLRWGLFAMGAPEHQPLRRAVIAGLSAGRVAALAPAVAGFADELAGAARRKGTADLVADLALPLASRAFCALAGLPDRDAPAIAAEVTLVAGQMNAPDPERAPEANRAARTLLARLRAAEGDGTSALMADIAARLPAGSPATAAELVAAFVFDAVETTASGLTLALDALMAVPDLGAQDPGEAVDEAFRLTSPTLLTSRIAATDLRYGDAAIPAGSLLLMWWAAGNRDRRVFADPDRFDANRPVRRHLAFGVGAHACLGRQLTVLLARQALRALLLDGPPARPASPRIYLPRLARLPEAAPIVFG